MVMAVLVLILLPEVLLVAVWRVSKENDVNRVGFSI